MTCTLIQGDCIQVMQDLIDDGVKVDCVLTDPPFGTTCCSWDICIPFEPMWECINKLSKERTPSLLFGSEPFSSRLRLSNFKNYKYDWIWNKKMGSNFLNANRMPLPSHEIISVFYKKLPLYNPQKRYVGVKYQKPKKCHSTHTTYGKVKEGVVYNDDGYRFPLSVIECDKSKSEVNNSKRSHPTQKPIKLLEYLIKTYTKEGDTVLDFTMGVGSTGVACANLNRKFIGIELDNDYFKIAEKRIKEAYNQKRLI